MAGRQPAGIHGVGGDRGREQPRPPHHAAPPGLAALPARGTVGGDQLAQVLGRPRGHRHAEHHLLRGDGTGQDPGDLQRQRPVADRAHDPALGHRGAAADVAPRDPQRRCPLVPGLHRARSRFRPGQPAHPGRARRRRVRRHGPQDLDLHRPPGQVGPLPRAHRPHRHRARGQARGDHGPHRRHGAAWHRGQRHPRHHRRRAVLRGQLRQAHACLSPTGSERRTRAGTWPWGRWPTRGSAPRGCRCPCASSSTTSSPRPASTTRRHSRTPGSGIGSPACGRSSSSPVC